MGTEAQKTKEVSIDLTTQNEFEVEPTQFEAFSVVVAGLGCTDLLEELNAEALRQAASQGLDMKEFILETRATIDITDGTGMVKVSVGPDRRVGNDRLLYKLDLRDRESEFGIRFYGMEDYHTSEGMGFTLLQPGEQRGKRVMGNMGRVAVDRHPTDPAITTATDKVPSTGSEHDDAAMVCRLLTNIQAQHPTQLNIARVVLADSNPGSVLVLLQQPVRILYGDDKFDVVTLEMQQVMGKPRTYGVEDSVTNHGKVLLWMTNENPDTI